MTQKNKKEKRAFCMELEEIEQRGIQLYLNGSTSSPREITKACYVREEGIYMRDYISDEGGRIKELDFNKIVE